MFSMKNFVMPTDPHAVHAKAKDAPTVVFKPKKEAKNEVPKLKAEKAVDKPAKPMNEVIEKVVRIPEGQEKAIPVEKRTEVAKPMNEVPTKKKIRFEKGSADAIEWGKEMSLRRKLKKDGTMKEKVVEVKPMTETIVAESVKVPSA